MSDHIEGGGGCASAEHAQTPSGAAATQLPSGDPGANQANSGAMNAYDIPRYSSEGYVLGRPETANDPISAGMVQGAPAGEPYQPAVGTGAPGQVQAPQSAAGTMGQGAPIASAGQDMAGIGPEGQPGQPSVQPPPQGMAYGTTGPIYGQPPRQGMVYGTTGPIYGQPPQQGMVYGTTGPVYDQPPQGMVYGTTGPVYGQPGVQPPGMAYHPGIDPAYAASGYDPYGAHPGAQQPPGIADPGNAEHYDRIADVVKDIANGEQPDVSKLAALYSGFDSQFWKGALIGAVLAVLLTSNTVKTALAGTMGAIFGALKKEDEDSQSDAE